MTTRYPLFYRQVKKVTLQDIFELTRSRFEGTQWDRRRPPPPISASSASSVR